MRISDWSSDVCSSDLHPAAQHDAEHAINRDLQLLIIDALDNRPKLGQFLFIAGSYFLDITRLHALHVGDRHKQVGIACGVNLVIAALNLLRDRSDGLIRYLVRDDDRSEEHTSELQSLMSISYAVFCLKKKNHTADKHNLEKT